MYSVVHSKNHYVLNLPPLNGLEFYSRFGGEGKAARYFLLLSFFQRGHSTGSNISKEYFSDEREGLENSVKCEDYTS